MKKKKSVVEYEWDGQWWVGIPAATRDGAIDKAKGRETSGRVWIKFDDLCDAFPGFVDLAMPI